MHPELTPQTLSERLREATSILAKRPCVKCSQPGVSLYRKSDGQPFNLAGVLRTLTWKDSVTTKGIALCVACATPAELTAQTQAASTEKQRRRDFERNPSINFDSRIDNALAQRFEALQQAYKSRGRARKALFERAATLFSQLLVLQREKEQDFDWEFFQERLRKTSGLYTQNWKPDSKWHWQRALNAAKKEAGAIPGLPMLLPELKRYMAIAERNRQVAESRNFPESAKAWARVAELTNSAIIKMEQENAAA